MITARHPFVLNPKATINFERVFTAKRWFLRIQRMPKMIKMVFFSGFEQLSNFVYCIDNVYFCPKSLFQSLSLILSHFCISPFVLNPRATINFERIFTAKRWFLRIQKNAENDQQRPFSMLGSRPIVIVIDFPLIPKRFFSSKVTWSTLQWLKLTWSDLNDLERPQKT